MKIIMAGIDYNSTPIELREKLSFNNEMVFELNKKIRNEKNINGCTIISTCNRTEIYISCEDNADIKADRLLIEKSKLDYSCFENRFYRFENKDAVKYLIEVGCGLKSQILGEGQIVTQINNAIKLSREIGASDAYLETLFRLAVTAGKVALTRAKLVNVPTSASFMAVETLDRIYNNNLKNKKCVVIGNGKMGRLAEKLLINKGAEVYVTLRSYKYGETIVPYGCKTIDYKNRFEAINNSDVVISATKSPHYTVTVDDLAAVANKPKVIIDLAMPRDIDPKVGELKGIKLLNIDDFKTDADFNKTELDKIYKIVDKYTSDYYKWENYKKCLPQFDEIKTITAARIFESDSFKNFANRKNDISEIVDFSVSKAIEIIMGGIKEDIKPKTIQKLKNKIEERARL